MSLETKQVESKENFKDYVIVGIGEGGGTLGPYDSSVYNRYPSLKNKVDNGATYVSVEGLKTSGTMFLRESKKEVNSRYLNLIRKWKGPKRTFTEGDVNNLIFPDETVNEMWMENVAGDPDSGFSLETIEELKRVLVKGGTINIFEEYTPELIIDFLEELKVESPDFDVEIYKGEKLFKYLVNELGFDEKTAKKRSANSDKFLAVLTKI
jgi:hypothetical protein